MKSKKDCLEIIAACVKINRLQLMQPLPVVVDDDDDDNYVIH